MKPAIIGVGCTIAALSALTPAVAQTIYIVEESPYQQIHTVPNIGTPSIISYPSSGYPSSSYPSIISYPSSSYPYSQGYSIPVAPTLPPAPLAPILPTAPTYGAPYSSNSTITLPSIEIHPRRHSTYRYRGYPSSRSRTIYINPGRSEIRKTIIYSYPTYPYGSSYPYAPFGR